MGHALKLHPDSRCDTVSAIEVDVARPQPTELTLQYTLVGRMGGVSVPAAAAPARADGLWRHTCFEAFIRAGSRSAYHEFNFAPSMRWAAFGFDDYRSGMGPAMDVEPRLHVHADESSLVMQVTLALDHVLGRVADSPWRIGLSAVIEETSGRLSYWALAHRPGKPDFHHPDCFALTLPPA